MDPSEKRVDAPVTKRRRQSWTIEQKLFAINTREQEPKPTLDDISVAFEARFKACASKTTLSNWLQPKSVERVRALSFSEYGKSRRRVRAPTCPKLEAAVYTWVRLEEARVGTLSGEAIFQKAKELALKPELEVPPGFRFSQGWLSRFKSRHGITRNARKQSKEQPPKKESHSRENFTQLLQDSPRQGMDGCLDEKNHIPGDPAALLRPPAPLAIVSVDGNGSLMSSQPHGLMSTGDPNAPFLTSTPLGLIKTEHAASLMGCGSSCNNFLGEAAEYFMGGSSKISPLPGDPAPCFMEVPACGNAPGELPIPLLSLPPLEVIPAQSISDMASPVGASVPGVPALQTGQAAMLSQAHASADHSYIGSPADNPSQ